MSFLEILERVLRDPFAVFEERATHNLVHVFYRVDCHKFCMLIFASDRRLGFTDRFQK
jgi:hypothetical protein